MRKLLGPVFGKMKIARYDMIDPKVQLHSDIGALTFCLDNINEEGKIFRKWKATEVYCKINRKWKIIHSHWSLDFSKTAKDKDESA